MRDRENQNYNRLITRSRTELNKIFREELRKRLENPKWYSEDAALSKAVINAAYSGNEILTTWQKADATVDRYYLYYSPEDAFQNLLDSDLTDFIFVNKKVLALCIYFARKLHGRRFTPTQEELDEWKKYYAAVNQATNECKTYYQQLLPQEDQFLPDEEIARRARLLQEKESYLNAAVRKALDDDYERKKFFSERSGFEYDELLEQMPSFYFDMQYYSFVRQNNLRYQENMRHSKTALRAPETFALAAPRPNETYTNEEMAPRIHKAIEESQREIAIVCPWLNMKVVRENFLEEFRDAIARGVYVRICYGIKGEYQSDKDKTRSEWSDKTADMLRKELGTEKLEIIRRNTHDKFIFCDDEYYLEGSFNLLSFDGDYSRKDQRHEHMTLSYDKELLQRYKAEYFS
ncbi:MAG: hypothetical protein IJL14_03360 [Selenomonadaceae bacterium]|nr:hypothetical protein [Selenomonadaceae bacterium]MBQ6005268.1 hypothetical protein [Selenomonadaceae bacterium]